MSLFSTAFYPLCYLCTALNKYFWENCLSIFFSPFPFIFCITGHFYELWSCFMSLSLLIACILLFFFTFHIASLWVFKWEKNAVHQWAGIWAKFFLLSFEKTIKKNRRPKRLKINIIKRKEFKKTITDTHICKLIFEEVNQRRKDHEVWHHSFTALHLVRLELFFF